MVANVKLLGTFNCYGVICPRISPPPLFSVLIFTYDNPSTMADNVALSNRSEPAMVPDVPEGVGNPNNTPANAELSALPWICAAVAGDDSPEYGMSKSNWFPMRVSVPEPVPPVTTGVGRSLAPFNTALNWVCP